MTIPITTVNIIIIITIRSYENKQSPQFRSCAPEVPFHSDTYPHDPDVSNPQDLVVVVDAAGAAAGGVAVAQQQ